MDHITIRQAGPYAITTDGNRYYANGKQAFPVPAPKGAPAAVALMLDTGCMGANGKRDLVGLTAAQVQVHTDAVAAVYAADTARLAATPASAAVAFDRADIEFKARFEQGFRTGRFA